MKRNKLTKLLALMLVLALILPVDCLAAQPETVEPYAFTHIFDYGGWVTAQGSGKVEAYVYLLAYRDMLDIGAETVQIYESTDNVNWTWKTSYRLRDDPSMMGHNTNFHDVEVVYQGVAGRYYRAHMSILARDASGEETRFFFTSSIQAT